MARPTKPASLDTYRQKRHPERTPEPFGGPSLEPGSRFVVHKHWARNLHYDLRLELDGVLKSWAVPKGPSTHVEEKRLAVHVEDHPLEYGAFEGTIPAGNYGAGSVIIWDKGWYQSFKPEDIREQYERGKLELEMFGFKLRGRWTLVRMGGKQKEWLLLKKNDGAATKDELIDRYPQSVVCGLTVEEMRDVPAKLASLRDRAAELGAPEARVPPKSVSFMLATLSEKPFTDPAWLFEVKYDGVRVLAFREDDRVELYGRQGNDITNRYPDLVEALSALAVPRFLLDGEIVAPDETGQPSFQRLQKRMHLSKPRDIAKAAAEAPVNGVFFDALSVMGFDLRKLALIDRKGLLAEFLPPVGTARFGDHVLEQGEALFEAASEHRLEGIVAKRLKSAYVGRRTTDWVKLKCQRRQEFVIGGYTVPQGSRGHFGALHIGVHEDGRLVYVTKVGSGFDQDTLKSTWDRLQPLRRDRSPFEVDSPKGRDHTWVEPTLVCEVRFTEWTKEGGLRHPTFIGLRDDKRPEDVRREDRVGADAEVGHEPREVGDEPREVESADVAEAGAEGEGPATKKRGKAKAETASPKPASPSKPALPAPGTAGPIVAARAPTRREVKLTNQDKVFWPKEGYTKGDLVRFYETMAPLLLPYLRDRPLVLTRYPDGIDGKSFFQKDAPQYATGYVRTESVYSKENDREIKYFVVDDEDMLRYVANLGTIPLHVWSARVGSLETPDWLVLDLDPKEAPFSRVVEVARILHDLLADLDLPSYVKTSGATGLHVLLPMGRRYTHEETRTFARLLAMIVVESAPEIATVVRAVQAREGKVYVDFGQNGHGNTIVGPYSVRPLPGAPASCPLDWDEVNGKLVPAKFTIRTIPQRFADRTDPMVAVLTGSLDMKRAIAAIERRMSS